MSEAAKIEQTAAQDDLQAPPGSTGVTLPSPDVANAVADASQASPSPLREGHIQNAVAFLAHPKVRDPSPRLHITLDGAVASLAHPGSLHSGSLGPPRALLYRHLTYLAAELRILHRTPRCAARLQSPSAPS
jgi:hypothetical protein